MKKQIILMDRPRIQRSLKRLAIQVWENLGSPEEIIIIGLNERGYATAVEMSKYLEEFLDNKQQVYRYDVSGNAPASDIPECTDKAVLLVDDVIFSGKTMFKALSAVCSANDPQRIDIVTLLDRGHRRYPLQSNLTGITVPTKAGEHIEVMLEDGTLNQAVLFKNVNS